MITTGCRSRYAEVFDFGPTNCASANQYKYGLENLNQYMEETGVATIIENFKQANLTYLIGEYDFGGQTSTCARMVQGNSRLIRTHIYLPILVIFMETVFIALTEWQKYHKPHTILEQPF